MTNDKRCRCLRRPDVFSSLSFSQRRNKTWPANVQKRVCVFCTDGQEVSTQLTLRIILKMKTLIWLEALQSTNALQGVIIFGSNPFPLHRNLVTLLVFICVTPWKCFCPVCRFTKECRGKNVFCCLHSLGAATQLNELSAALCSSNSSDSNAQPKRKKRGMNEWVTWYTCKILISFIDTRFDLNDLCFQTNTSGKFRL